MEEKQLKFAMESLWKETFRDSSQYVNLVFDNYFNPDLLEYHSQGEEIVASLLGVPYEFQNGEGQKLKGLYLCGLSTKREFRRKGIMGTLLERINAKAGEKGFDFTFLIPSNEGMRRYYSDRGYQDSFYKIREYYVYDHDFALSLQLKLKEISEVDMDLLLDFLCDYQSLEKGEKNHYSLKHSRKDWEIVIKEAMISKMPIRVALKDTEIAGCVFLNELKHHEAPTPSLEIKKIISTDEQTESEILKALEMSFPGYNISIDRDAEELYHKDRTTQIWSPFFARNNSKEAEYEDIAESEEIFDPMVNAYSYGMIRIIDPSLFLKKMELADSDSLTEMSEKDALKIVLRRPEMKEGEDTLEKLLEIPAFSFSISLLLD